MNLHRIVIVFASFMSVLFLPVTGFSGPLDRGSMQERYNPAAESMLRVPGVVGMYEQDARAYLQQSGLAVDVEHIKNPDSKYEGKEGMVIKQDPSTGGIAMLGASVTITIYSPTNTQTPSSEGLWGGGNDSGAWVPPPAEEESDQEYGTGEEVAPIDPGVGTGWMPPQNGQNAENETVEESLDEGEGQLSSSGKTVGTFVATPVPQTVTLVDQGITIDEVPNEDGSCRSWYAIAVDITAEAQRIAKELGCAAVQPPAMWKACIKHIDKIGKWNAYNIQLKKRWNRLVKKTSWAAIGPRELTFGKTHKGRLFGTTGRTFITPVPIFDESINIKLNKKAGKSRTSVTVCSYMPGGDRIKEWHFESPSGNKNKGQSWEKNISNIDGKLLSIHLDGKSTADTFQYSIFLEGN